MNETLPPTSDHSINRLIAEYLQAIEAGKVPSREELLAQHPECAEELRRFFADFDRVDRGAASLRVAGPNTSDYTDTPPGTLPKVRYFGDYELLEEIARGGMGVVYKARQVSLSRLVALKMLLKGEHATEKDAARFQAEAEAAAGLDHPNIVPIYEIGTHEGRQYLAMKFIEGKSLAKVERSDARTEAARLLTIAKAVHFAHQRGVLHRDLKPGNILVDDAGIHYVADFGLAKRVDAQVSLSETGDVIGTPRYMAPEQANGKKGLTTAVDTYALGVILYERLTGRTPHQGQTLLEILRQLREETPANPRSLEPTLDRDLETICMKCLEKEPGQRYATTGELAEELERWLNGEPIQARPVGQMERAWRWCKRNPVVSGLSAGIASILLLATGLSLGLANWALGEKDRADVNAEQANQNADRAETVLARSFLRPFEEGYWQSPNSIGVNELQVHPLWELAENRGERVWFKTIEEALKEPRTTRQLIGNAQVLLHAAVGLDPTKRDKLTDLLLSHLRDPLWKQRHTDVALLLGTLGGATDAVSEQVFNQLVVAITHENSESNIDDLGTLLTSLVDRLGPASASQLATRVMEELKLENNATKVYWLVQAVVALAVQLDPAVAEQHLQTATAQVLVALKQSNDSNEITNLVTAILTIADRLEPSIAKRHIQATSARVLWVLENTSNSATILYLLISLESLAVQLEQAAAEELMHRAATRVLALMEQETDAYRMYQCAKALDSLAGRLSPLTTIRLVQPVAVRVLIMLEQEKNAGRLENYARALVTLKAWLEPPAVGSFITRLLLVLEKEKYSTKLYWVAFAIGELSDRLERAASAPLLLKAATDVYQRMAEERNATKVFWFAQTLDTLAGRLNPSETTQLLQPAATQVLVALENENNSNIITYYSKVLLSLANRLDSAASIRLVQSAAARVSSVLEKEKIASNLENLTISMAVLSDQLDSSSGSRLLQSAAARVLAALEQENDPTVNYHLARAIATLADRLEPAIALPLVRRATVHTLATLDEQRDCNYTIHLSLSLAMLARHLQLAEQDMYLLRAILALTDDRIVFVMPMESASPDTEALTDGLTRSSPSLFAQRLAAGFNSFTGLPPAALIANLARAAEPFSARFSDEFMVELLHRPIAVGPWRRAILDALGTRHRQYFRDQWDFVRYAQQQKLNLDFTAGPKRKLPENLR